MSIFSRKTSVRRAVAVAAPLAVAALALSACNPVHPNDIVSPTPSGSHLATPYSAAPEAAEHAGNTGFFDTEATYTVKSLQVGSKAVDTGDFSGVSVSGDAASEDGALILTLGLCDGSMYAATGEANAATASAGEAWNTDKCGDPTAESVAKAVHQVLEGKLSATTSGDTVTLKGAKGSLVLAPQA